MAKKVLLVEDDEVLRRTVMRSLRMDGYEADAAADLEEAVKMLASGSYDVCISDGNFPDAAGGPEVWGNGIALYHRAAELAPGTRFVVWAGRRDVVDAAKRKGIETYSKGDYSLKIYDIIEQE